MAAKLDFATMSLQDALDLAVLIEKEAEERYRLFVDQLGGGERGDAADFFSMMAGYEQQHGKELANRRKALFGDAPSRVSAEMVEEVEAPGMGKPRPYMSTRHALEVAMESEIKAYDFFNDALPGIKDPDVRKLFEELRDEEAEHQALLNEQKTKYPDSMAPTVDPDDIDTPAL
ncbi:MAG: ferritin family protein [Georgfuchsia sp.]